MGKLEKKGKPKQIAIYGKGGIGKSTTTSNISVALAELGLRVIQIGCDPKSDSTNSLRGGKFIPTVLDALKKGHGSIDISEIVHEGYARVFCVECGGPEPGVGCAGRGIITAINILEQKGVFRELNPDVVIYDVLGDVVCGGFAMPIREGLAEQVYAVTSSDFMAIYAANNLFKGIKRYSDRGGALLGGIIANSVKTLEDRDLISDFAGRTKTKIIDYVPRSATVTECELKGRSVLEGAPNSKQADVYREVASRIVENGHSHVPAPLEIEELWTWAGTWADVLLAKNNGGKKIGHEEAQNLVVLGGKTKHEG